MEWEKLKMVSEKISVLYTSPARSKNRKTFISLILYLLIEVMVRMPAKLARSVDILNVTGKIKKKEVKKNES